MKPSEATILLVDDDVCICKTLSDILSERGYEVLTAHDGYQATAQVKENDLSAVLMDIRMPGMDGVETARIMRDQKPNLRIMLMTAFTADLVQDSLKGDPMTVYFKPLDIDRIIDDIRNGSKP